MRRTLGLPRSDPGVVEAVGVGDGPCLPFLKEGSDATRQVLSPGVRRVRHGPMPTATLSTKGQLVIPTRLRKALSLQPGDEVQLTLEGRRLVLERRSRQGAKLARGKSGRPVLVAPPDAPPMTTATVNAILAEES